MSSLDLGHLDYISIIHTYDVSKRGLWNVLLVIDLSTLCVSFKQLHTLAHAYRVALILKKGWWE